MIGTIVNTAAIIAGSTAGSLFNKGIKKEKKTIMFQALGLACFAIGASNVVKGMNGNEQPILFIVSLVIGGLIGQWLNLEERIKRLNERFGGKSDKSLVDGVTTAVMIFCIGTLSILGPIESALNNNHTLLFTNAMLDAVTSLILASTFGIGIMLSAGILFLWQGSIYLIAINLGSFATPELMTQLSIVGGLLILSTGFNILGFKKIKTINLIPSLLIVILYYIVTQNI